MAEPEERIAKLETEIKWHRLVGPLLIVGVALYFGTSLNVAKREAVKNIKKEIESDALGKSRVEAKHAAQEALSFRNEAKTSLERVRKLVAQIKATSEFKIVRKKGLQNIAAGTHAIVRVGKESHGIALVTVRFSGEPPRVSTRLIVTFDSSAADDTFVWSIHTDMLRYPEKTVDGEHGLRPNKRELVWVDMGKGSPWSFEVILLYSGEEPEVLTDAEKAKTKIINDYEV